MNIQLKNNFYVYALIRPDKNNEYFYIGKGFGRRMFDHFELSKQDTNKHKKNIIRKLLKLGYTKDQICKPLVVCNDEKYAFEIETALIKKIGRYDLGFGPLTNMTDGGEGEANRIFSEETKRKMSEVKKGKYLGINNPFFGKTHSEETRTKISEATKGRVLSEDHKQKISKSTTGKNNPMFGKKHLKETIQKISEKAKVRPNPMTGKNHSDIAKQKMKDAWAKRKLERIANV